MTLRYTALASLLLTACGSDSSGSHGGELGTAYTFSCDESDCPEQDPGAGQDCLYFAAGKVSKSYVIPSKGVICVEEPRGSYRATASGYSVVWSGDAESPSTKQELSVANGVLSDSATSEELGREVTVALHEGSPAECGAE